MSSSNNQFDPEIWTLSLVGDVFGFVDEAFLDMDVKHRDALKLYLDNADLEGGLYAGVIERLLEYILQTKSTEQDLPLTAH